MCGFTNSLCLFAGPFRHTEPTLDHVERDSPHINAPVWPWSLAGWVVVVALVAFAALAAFAELW
jgi:hypothetical protein